MIGKTVVKLLKFLDGKLLSYCNKPKEKLTIGFCNKTRYAEHIMIMDKEDICD